MNSRIPKILGADTELGNFILGSATTGGSGHLASRLLLKHMPGISGFSSLGTYAYRNPQDIGRKWHSNGSCFHIDLDHLECAMPEVTNAWDFTAAHHAQLQLVQAAIRQAAESLPPHLSLQVFALNSDGLGASWGSHLNVCITRRCFENVFHRRLHLLLWLASYTACAGLISGQGKVGAENQAPSVDYQITARADFMEEIVGVQTTFRRPLINCRDESLTGDEKEVARFHYIASDVNLAHTANVLKTGILQILMAMAEAEAPQIGPEVLLQDPVSACRAYSHDPDLNATALTLDGEFVTSLELQRRFFDEACRFVAAGG